MKRLLPYLLWAVICFVVAAGVTSGRSHRVVARSPQKGLQGREVLYIRNLDQQDISDRTIRRDIPAWEHAVPIRAQMAGEKLGGTEVLVR